MVRDIRCVIMFLWITVYLLCNFCLFVTIFFLFDTHRRRSVVDCCFAEGRVSVGCFFYQSEDGLRVIVYFTV